jgi:hypothetical protein
MGCIPRPPMKATLLTISALLAAYIMGFIALVFFALKGQLPRWLEAAAEFVYAPVLFVLNHIFGGMC